MKIRKSVKLISFAFVLLICFAFIFTDSKKVSASEVINSDIKEMYAFGEEFIVPENVEIKLSNNESIVSNKSVLIFPDGKSYQSGLYTLSQEGIYTLIYSGNYNNTEIRTSETFTVKNQAYYVTSSRSELEYGSLDTTNKTGGADGLKLKLAEGDKFVFSKTVNLYEKESWDICQIFPDMRDNTSSKPNVFFVTLKLVDYYDRDSFVEFYLWSQAETGFYLGAGANNQKLGGLEAYSATGASNDILYNGANYRYHSTLRYASSNVFGGSTYGGRTTETYADIGGFNIQFEPKTGKVYRSHVNANGERHSKLFIMDIVSEQLHGSNGFKGFSTGDVYAEIQCYGYNTQFMNIEVQSLLGFSGEDLKSETEKLSSIINFDVNKTTEDSISILKGKEFSLPKITVNNPNYADNLKISLYYNYGQENQTVVFFKNNRLTPDKTGTYTAVYDIYDVFGDCHKEIFNFNVIDSEKAINYSVEKANLKVGEEIIMPLAEVSGLNKQIITTITIVEPDGTVRELDSTQKYSAKTLGKYSINYNFMDNVYSDNYSYDVVIENSDAVSFYDLIKLPDYFIKDASYSIDDMYAYTADYASTNKHLTTVYVSEDGGEYKKIDDTKNFSVSGNNTLKFKFEHNNVSVESEDKKIVDVSYNTSKDYSKYFIGEYTSVEKLSSGITYNFDGNQQSGKLSFINLVSFSQFQLNFEIPQNKENFSSVKITLTDYANPSNKIVVNYKKVAKGVEFSVNDMQIGVMTSSFAANNQSFWVDYATSKILNNKKHSAKINAFDGELCYFTIELEDITGESAISIKSINNQNINSNLYEANPQVRYAKAEGSLSIGDIYTIKDITVSSVFNPVKDRSVSITITDPLGENVRNNKGEIVSDLIFTEKFSINIDKPGIYMVAYKVAVSTGLSGSNSIKTTTIKYPINVLDNIPPVIAFNNINEKTVKKVDLGKQYKVESFTASDNYTAKEELYTRIYIYNESNHIINYNKNTIVFEKVGLYRVVVYCYDAEGNFSSISYKVSVN